MYDPAPASGAPVIDPAPSLAGLPVSGPPLSGPPAPPALGEAAEELLPWACVRLRQLVEISSPTGDAVALDAVGAAIAAGHAEAGAQTMPLAGPHGDHLLSHWAGADPARPPILLVGHSDTTWPIGLLPCTDDGAQLTGPGALDGKSGLVVAEMAIRALNMAGLAPAQPVRLLVSADAQQGHPSSRGYLTAESARAGAVLGLGQPGGDGSLVTGRPGAVRVVLTVTGQGAVDELIEQLGRVRVLLGSGVLLNVGRIGGGLAAYDVPDLAAAELGLLVENDDAAGAALAAFAGLRPLRTGSTVVAEALGQLPAWPAPVADPLLGWVRSIGARYGLAIAGAPGDSAADANHAGAAGAPTLDGFGGVGARFRGASGAHEHVRLDSLVPRAMLLAALLAQPLPIGE